MVNVAQVTEVADDQSHARMKAYGFVLITALLALAAGYLFSLGLHFYGLAAVFVYFAFFVLKVLFIDDRNILIVGSAADTIAIALPFFRILNLFFAVVLVLLFLLLLGAAFRGRREARNMMKVHILKVTRITTSILVTALVVFLGAVVILGGNYSVSRERVDQTLRVLVAPVVRRYVPEFSPDMSTRKLLSDFSERSIAAETELGKVPEGARDALVDKAVEDLHQRIDESIGTSIDIDAPVGANVREIVGNKLGKLTPTARLYWGAFALALVWISIKGVEFVIYIPLAMLVFLLYEIALSVNFAKVQLERRDSEVVSLT